MEKKITPVIILCGGYGSRLGEEGKKTPKALIKIGGKIKYDLDDVRRMKNESYIETD